MAKLETELRPDEQKRLTAADVLARWQARGLVGAWASRVDIEDGAAYARRLRERTQTRVASTDEAEDAS